MKSSQKNVGSKGHHFSYFVSSVSLYIWQKGWNLVNVGEDLLFHRKGGGVLDKIEELVG